MPSKHEEGKRQHAQWFTDDEWQALKSVSREMGTNVTGLMRMIATGEIAVEYVGKGE